MNQPRLLVVEDDRRLAALLVDLFAGEGYRVDVAHDGQQGLHRGLTGDYDAAVIDRGLPVMDGAELVTVLRQRGVGTPVLLLTARGTLEDRVSGLDGGANDYLVKPFEFEELLARLRALTRGYAAEGRRRYVGDWVYTPDTMTIYSPFGTRISLTATENQLLELLSSSPEHVFSREEILQSVFKPDDSPGTVDTYVHYLRRKTSKDLVETVRAQGYRLGDLP